jgi:Lrp/AsnC family transcriptional regulator, leucine-responsive regulatory protein
MELDAQDRLLVRALQAEGRATCADLAGRIGLTAAPTQARITKMEAAGVLRGYAARVDRTKLGYGLLAFVSVVLASHEPEREDAFVAAMREIPEVQECHHVAGEEDYLLKVVARDVADLERVVRAVSTPQVRRVRTTLVLSSAKDTAEVPVRP